MKTTSPMDHARRGAGRRFLSLATATAVATLAATQARAADPGLTCQKAVAGAVQTCVKKLSAAQAACYAATGSACAEADPKAAAATAAASAKVSGACTDAPTLTAAGFGANVTPAGLASRAVAICEQQVGALVARSFGGPHAQVLADGNEAVDKCLFAAHKAASKATVSVAKASSKCVLAARGGKTCDTAALDAKINDIDIKARGAVSKACPGGLALTNLVALTNVQYVERAVTQADCMTAAAHPDPSPLTPLCGPRTGLPAPARGAWTQVVLDSATYGTGCGDLSDYAFSIRLAPPGFPVDRVVVRMQGGGVCLGDDCCTRPADLFEAMADHPPENAGMLSTDDGVNPFANWTLVALPYCNQDVFAGGGGTTTHNTCEVFRNGATNVRRAMEQVRDILWTAKDSDSGEAGDGGYAPQDVELMFGGHSAGAYGTLYNYHWVLDDLQWPRSTAWPDAGLALDNGGTGIATFGGFVFNDALGFTWGARQMAASYCFANDCGVGTTVLNRTSPRLDLSMGQAFMVLSNQVDDTQVSTQFFSATDDWINAARAEYCDTKGLPGVHWFFPARTASVHVITPDDDRFSGVDTDMVLGGVTMAEWLEGGRTNPLAVPDLTEEGTLTLDIPGVDPFPCMIP